MSVSDVVEQDGDLDGLGASIEAIQRHYDVGSEFYRLWLGPEMVYSAARWRECTSDGVAPTLERAQENKLDFHLRGVGAMPGFVLLDVGCGWGAALRRAKRVYGVKRAVGLTLSRDQYESVAGLREADIELYLESYNQHPDALYDGVISIGAFEHFARPGIGRARKIQVYRAFFHKCRRWLKPGGRLSLQTICWGSASKELRSKILPEHVFGESDLPSADEIMEATQGVLEPLYFENSRSDYIRTLECWLDRLRMHRDDIQVLSDGAVLYHHYEEYLRKAIVGFRRGRIYLLRFVLRRF